MYDIVSGTEVCLVVPVLNDWESAALLKDNILKALLKYNILARIIYINDCSTLSYKDYAISYSELETQVVSLISNVSHQRAICIGLTYIQDNNIPCDYIIVLDGDGEDNPADIPKLIDCCLENNDTKIVFAQRKKRTETFRFKSFYLLYKCAYKALTGRSWKFGNFSCIPKPMLERTISNAFIWNHYAGSIMKANIPYESIPINRDSRYFGKSKMNTISLINHGLSCLSLYMDVIVIRLLSFSFIIMLVAGFSLGFVAAIKIFTNSAIPGWATSTSLGLIIIFFQVFLFGFFLLLMHLSNRNTVQPFPVDFYKKFILHTDTIECN